MKVEITKNKLLSVSLIAVIGASFLASCNNKKSDSKDQNQQTSAPGGNGGAGAGTGAGTGTGTGGGAVDPSLVDDEIADLANNDLNKTDDEAIDTSALPSLAGTVSAELQALKLNERSGLQLRIKSLCGDKAKSSDLGVFNNNNHRTPVAFELYDKDGLVSLTPDQLNAVRKSLYIKDYENASVSRQLEAAEMDPNNTYIRCANGAVPAEAKLNNAFYVKPSSNSAKQLRLVASLELVDGSVTVHSIAPKAKFKDALTIPVLENKQKGKTDLFHAFDHVFKVENSSSKEKFKYLTAKYVGKGKSNENYELKVEKILITDNDGTPAELTPVQAKLDQVHNPLTKLNIGANKELLSVEFLEMNKSEAEIQTLLKDNFTGVDFSFSGSKVKDLSSAVKKVQTEKTSEKAIGFIFKLDDRHSSKEHSPITVTVTGKDSFGNDFTSIIKEPKL